MTSPVSAAATFLPVVVAANSPRLRAGGLFPRFNDALFLGHGPRNRLLRLAAHLLNAATGRYRTDNSTSREVRINPRDRAAATTLPAFNPPFGGMTNRPPRSERDKRRSCLLSADRARHSDDGNPGLVSQSACPHRARQADVPLSCISRRPAFNSLPLSARRSGKGLLALAMLSRAVLPRCRGAWLKTIASVLAAAIAPAILAAETHRFGLASVTFDGRVVTFANDLTRRDEAPQDFGVTLTNGIAVQVIILQADGHAPDTMHVIPPAGYIAIPESVTVDEYDSGEILIVPAGLS